MSTAAAAKPILVVTKDELLELAEWERKYADAKKRTSAAEKEVNFRRQSLAEKVLGLKSSDEMKKLSPRQVDKLFTDRRAEGDWKPERGAPIFSFVETSHGSYPAWKQIYIGEFGESAAAGIVNDTPVTHSYAVEVTT